jgi:hypothetical protein
MNTKAALIIFMSMGLSTSFIGAENPQEKSEINQSEYETIVPEGTVIPIILTAYLNTRSNQTGDTVYADTTYPIWIGQYLVIPKGSTIRGTITEVVRPGRIKGKGKMAIRFDDILLPNGVKRDLVASFKGIHGPGEETVDRKSEKVEAGSSKGKDAGTVVGTTSQGAIIGVLAGGGKGAGIGAGIGGAAGLATVLFSRGNDLVLSPGTQFDLELKRSLKFAYNELDFTSTQLNNAQKEIRLRPSPPVHQGNRSNLPGIGLPRPF